MDYSNLYPVQMYCPNCGIKITGYKDDDGALKTDCPRCQVRIFSKQKGNKKINIEIIVSLGTKYMEKLL